MDSNFLRVRLFHLWNQNPGAGVLYEVACRIPFQDWTFPGFFHINQSENAMKQYKFLPFIVFLLITVLLMACSFTVTVIPTSTASAPTFTPPPPTHTSVPLTFAPPSVTPTLISIRDSTYYQLEIFRSFGEGEYLRSLAFTPNGTVLASAAGNSEDYAIHVWDVASGRKIGTLGGHADIVWDLAFSPDGQMLASVSSDKTAKVWDWRNGDILKILEFPGEVASVRFSPDGQSLAVGGVDEPQNQVLNAAIWTYSVDTWEPQVKFGEYWNIGALVYSPDGDTLVGGGTSRNLQVWRVDDPDPVFTLNHAHQVSKAAITPDSLTLAAATCTGGENAECTEGSIWLWELSTGRLIRKVAGLPNVIVNLAYTADGSTLIVGARDGTLLFLDTSDYGPRFESLSPGQIGALALSPDNGLLATGGREGEIHLWKVMYRP
jgi:WD40 repeat protein